MPMIYEQNPLKKNNLVKHTEIYLDLKMHLLYNAFKELSKRFSKNLAKELKN